MSKIFDSRDPEYKSPFGAAACGAAVRFAVRPGTENVTGVSLLLRREFGGTEQALPLSPSGRPLASRLYRPSGAGPGMVCVSIHLFGLCSSIRSPRF